MTESLCSTVFQPSFGSFSNIFGRKPVVLIALVFFLVGAIVSGTSTNLPTLLIGRSIQGVGGGGIITLIEIIITDLIPLRLRGQYFGLIGSMLGIGSAIGPLLGAGCSERVSWRWIFYINLPFIGGALVLVPLCLRVLFTPKSVRMQLLRYDYVGTFLFITSTVSFLTPLTWGGVMYPWQSFRTLVPLCIGAAGFIAFIIYDIYAAADPLIPMSIFGSPTAMISYFGAVVHGFAIWCLLYYFPFYFEAVKEYSPVLAGVSLFPILLTLAPSAVVCGRLITKTGRYQLAIWAGWTISALGMGLLSRVKADTSTLGCVFLMLIPGLGLGILFPGVIVAVQASATPGQLPIAVAMCSFFRSFGQSIGVAIGGAVFQNRMRANILTYPALASHADDYSKNAAEVVHIVRECPDAMMKRDLQIAYSDSLRTVWAVCCAVLGCSMFLSAFTQEYDLNRAMQDGPESTDEGVSGGEQSRDKAM
ncbi:major facilitator superfamily domain-containing protein [Aspergillus bertholletiae]|uniref:Major facilitator superfamily domain-containing protein n=1 Tax=Aspergillus bertholletiae TaxID=1226010 RepID=A0A5N7ASM3_9EURO|nr:major facilitator superfamily domain-containing protein [Aspergillus bertholletiae]